MKSIAIAGFFAHGSDRPSGAGLTVTISGSGMDEQLTVDCKGRYRVMVAYRPIERLAAELRRDSKLARDERSLRLTGIDENLRRGSVDIWLRKGEGLIMLTLEMESRGQIYLPLEPVESLARAGRSGTA